MAFGKKCRNFLSTNSCNPSYDDKEDFVCRWIRVHQPFMSGRQPGSVTSASGVRPVYYSMEQVDEMTSKVQTHITDSSDDGYTSISDCPLTIEDLRTDQTTCRPSPLLLREPSDSRNRGNSKTEEWAQWRTTVNSQLAEEILTKRYEKRYVTDQKQLGRMSASCMVHVARKAQENSAQTSDYLLYGVPRVALASHYQNH